MYKNQVKVIEFDCGKKLQECTIEPECFYTWVTDEQKLLEFKKANTTKVRLKWWQNKPASEEIEIEDYWKVGMFKDNNFLNIDAKTPEFDNSHDILTSRYVENRNREIQALEDVALILRYMLEDEQAKEDQDYIERQKARLSK